MSKKELIKRYSLFLFSVLINGFGIAVITFANVGTTPISSSNYVLSLHCGLTLGQLTFIFNVLLIIAQYLLLNKQERKQQIYNIIMQVPITVPFCLAIDLGMFILRNFLPEEFAYPFHLALLITGTCVLAFGITLAVIADVSMVSGEYFVKIVAQKTNKEFGVIKTIFDVSLVILAVCLSLIFTGFTQIDGVREGTLIGALCVGPLVRVFLPRMKWISVYLIDKKDNKQTSEIQTHTFCNVITIAREYGCGGRVIGKMVAEKLGYEFYDTNLIELIAKESGLSKQTVSKNEGLDSALLYEMIMQDYSVPLNKSISSQDMLFVASAKVIRNIASKHNCVIVGRCADYILKDNPHCYNVFLFADIKKKLEFCLKQYKEAHDVALDKMSQFDKKRSEHYLHYTGKNIEDPHNYQMCIDVGNLGLDKSCELICSLAKSRFDAEKSK